MKTIKLSKRLEAVAGLIPANTRAADIGTDHGYLPVYLAQNDVASFIIASDIREGPLNSARRSAKAYGVEDKITFINAPGLSGVEPYSVDTIVIAGMGGETIADILRDAPWTRDAIVTLLLQPQSKSDELYTWLLKSGYMVTDASLVCDGGRIYTIIRAETEPSSSGWIPDTGLTEFLAHKRDPLFLRYADLLIAKTRRAAEGLSVGTSAEKEYLRITERLKILERLREEANNDKGE